MKEAAGDIQLLLTNDWELYGEGSGDFAEIQEARLKALLATVESHGARLNVFAEVGQQFAHLFHGQGEPALADIARRWEVSVREAVRRGHDVQLHYHPTWHRARRKAGEWQLDLATWALNDMAPEVIEDRLSWGKSYLESLGREEDANYECSVFRAGAFCIQPYDQTLPHLQKLGFRGDSSVVPGHWDYLHFDFRSEPPRFGPYTMGSLLEMPVHTLFFWDSPVIRHLLPMGLLWRFYGARRDLEHEKWAAERDATLRRLSGVQDPLWEKRREARWNWRKVPSWFVRRSALVLDYDFLAPEIFTRTVEQAAREFHRAHPGQTLTLVALGHANNAHNQDNLDRTLRTMKKCFGERLSYPTFREVIAQRAGH